MRCVISCAVLLVFSSALVCAQDRSGPKSAKLFEWFDRLGFEDVSEAKFVRIWTGARSIINGTQKAHDVSDGFLLEDNGETFRAVLADLTVGLFEKHGNDPEDPDFTGYRELQLDEEARRILKELRSAEYFEQWSDQEHYDFYDRISRAAQIFVLARRCAQRGQTTLASQLFDALAKHPKFKSDDFFDAIRGELARVLYLRACMSFRDPAQQWNGIREQLRRIVEHCPDTYHHKLAETVLRDVGLLIEEEAAHQEVSPEQLASLPPAAKAQELVWQLRNEQNISSDKHDYWPRPWPFVPRGPTGAMEELVRLGTDAVPALLLELKDRERLSRSVARSGRGGGLIIDTTLELVLATLEKIAGINFYSLAKWETPEERRPRLLMEVEQWWEAVSGENERRWLNDLVSGGGYRGLAGANRLLEKFPADFPEAAMKGAIASKGLENLYPHEQFIEHLENVDDPRVEPFLMEELKSSRYLGARLSVAAALRRKGRSEGEEMMRSEWERGAAAGFPHLDSEPEFGFPLNNAWEALAAFLLSGGSPESARAILASWEPMDLVLKKSVVSFLWSGNTRTEVSPEKVTEEFAGVMQALLLRGLEVTAAPYHGTTGGADWIVIDPRLCDLAARALQQHWPERFPFDHEAPETVRERQRLETVNQHRAKTGQELLLLPAKLPKVPKARGNHVTAVEWEAGAPAPKPALAKQLNGLKGKPFAPGSIATALRSYLRSPQADTSGLRVAAVRAGDGTGVVLRATLSAGKAPRAARWDESAAIRTGKQILLHRSGSGAAGAYDLESASPQFTREAARAMAAPLDQPFWIKASVKLSEE